MVPRCGDVGEASDEVAEADVGRSAAPLSDVSDNNCAALLVGVAVLVALVLRGGVMSWLAAASVEAAGGPFSTCTVGVLGAAVTLLGVDASG